jgi:hypothetical protein
MRIKGIWKGVGTEISTCQVIAPFSKCVEKRALPKIHHPTSHTSPQHPFLPSRSTAWLNLTGNHQSSQPQTTENQGRDGLGYIFALFSWFCNNQWEISKQCEFKWGGIQETWAQVLFLSPLWPWESQQSFETVPHQFVVSVYLTILTSRHCSGI